MNIGTLIATLGVDTTGLTSAEKNLQSFGIRATKYLTIPLTIIGGASINTFKKYEATLATIKGLTGATAEQTRVWTQQLEEMTSYVGKGPQELADALYYIASSGVDASQVMDILTISAKSSTAGLGSTQQIANLLTSAMNAYAQSGLSAADAADMLTVAVREGKIEASAFAEHIGYVIPIASQMGVSFDQVSAAMAAMSTTGADASTAATQLRQLLSDIIKPAIQSEEALTDFKSSGAELRDILREDGLLGAMNKITSIVKEFGEDAVAKVFPEVRALTGVLMLMGENADHVAEIFEEVANSGGAMENAFAISAETLQTKMNVALGQLQLSAIKLGEAIKAPLVDILNDLVKTLKSVTTWFSSLTETQQEFIIKVAGLAAILGPATLLISGMIKVLMVLKSTAILVSKEIGLLKMALVSFPGAGYALAISAIVVAMTAWGNSTNTMLDLEMSINEEIGKELIKLNSLFGILKNVNTSTEVRSEAINTVNNRYGEYLDNLLLEKSSLEEIAKAQAQATTGLIQNIKVKSYTKQIDKELEDLSNSYEYHFGKIEKQFSEVQGTDRLYEFQKALMESVDSYVSKYGNELISVGKGVDFFGVTNLEKAFDPTEAKNVIKAYFNGIEPLFFERDFLQYAQFKATKDKTIQDLTELVSKYQNASDSIEKSSVYKSLEEKMAVLDTLSKNQLITVQKNIEKQLQTEQAYSNEIVDKYKLADENILANEQKTNTDKIALLSKYLDETKAKLETFKPKVDTSAIDEILKKFNVDETSLDIMSNLDTAFVDGSDYVKLYDSVLKSLANEGMAETNDKMQELYLKLLDVKNTMATFTPELEPIELPDMPKADIPDTKTITTSLALIAQKEALLNDRYDSNTESIKAYEDAIDSWIKDGLEASSPVLQKLIADLTKLDQLTKTQQAWKQLGDAIVSTATNGADSWGEYADSVITSARTVVSAMAATALSKAIVSAMDSALAAGPLGLFLIPALTAIAIGAVNTALNQIPGFAEGGTVPAGYPNDTYPAMLSSGEMVVPAGKLPDFSKMQNQNSLEGNVEFKISGYDLLGVINKQSKKLNKV